MRGMVSYTQAAMERAMKVQEVILRAMAKRITWWQAAEIIGISDRQMRRWRERYEEFGYDGLFDRRQGKPSPKRVPVARVEQVLGLYRDRYFDLNVRHFQEKLQHEHQIELSYTWVKLALQGAGLVRRGRKRGEHLLRAVGGGRIDGNGDGSAARGGRAPGPVLRFVQRSRQPLLADSEGGRSGGSAPSDPGGTGAARTRDSHDSRVFAAGAGPR